MSPTHRQERTAWVAITALMTFAVLVVPLPAGAATPQAHRFEITARQFAYEPATLTVQRGDTITLRLESLDAAHGLFIDGYAVNLQAEPGKSAEVTFVADQAGKFKFRCSISCGALHPFMIGELSIAPDFPLVRAVVATLMATIGAVAYFWNRP